MHRVGVGVGVILPSPHLIVIVGSLPACQISWGLEAGEKQGWVNAT